MGVTICRLEVDAQCGGSFARRMAFGLRAGSRLLIVEDECCVVHLLLWKCFHIDRALKIDDGG
jgi:hypothetical protein